MIGILWLFKCSEAPTPDKRSIFGVSIDPADRIVSLVETTKSQTYRQLQIDLSRIWRRTCCLIRKFDSDSLLPFENYPSYPRACLDGQVVWLLLEICRCGSDS